MSRIRANTITNQNANGAPNFPDGITVTGVITATTLSQNLTGDLTISGNLGVGGTITYEDVKNVDSVGIITARSGIKIGTTAGVAGTFFADGSYITAGIITATTFHSSGKVGIGTDDPVGGASSGMFEIYNSAHAKNRVAITVNEAQNNAGRIDFKAATGSFSSANVQASVEGIITNSSGALTGDLVFHTNEGDSLSEKLRIASDGVVSIGTNDDDPAQLKVVYSTVPTYLTSTFDGTVGEATLSVNVPRTSDGSGSWGSHSNSGYGSAAIQALSHSSSGGYVTILTGNADNTNPTERLRIDQSGHVLPGANNSYDLGSTGARWRNVFTNDLNLSNKGSTNSVDNTWGDYTIQEGENDLFLINNRSGKKYKFNLTEVS